MTANLLDGILAFLGLGYLVLGFAAGRNGSSVGEELKGLVSIREWLEAFGVWRKS